MKYELPEGHGLPDVLGASQFVADADGIRITDVQHEALAAGVAGGASVLVTAPTSSGKTTVAVFAIGGWIAGRQRGRARAVYLVSHRALAREKFFEFRDKLAPLLGVEAEEVVFATGDAVVDGNGDEPADPLNATILVATYEKYLGLLSAVGMPSDLSDVCFVCDEFQVIGDEARGQDVEILITLLRRAHAGQIVGLSAVLDPADGQTISEWLDAREVRVDTREVELVYELRLPGETIRVSTRIPGQVQMLNEAPRNTIEIIGDLLRDPQKHAPIAVFCATRAEVFRLAEQWAAAGGATQARQLALAFDEETASSRELATYLPRAFGFHTADLVEPEREAVERALKNDDLQVVFATTTLAYGLNFSFKTIVVHSWERNRTPISAAEFHNMAGRAGRLGLADAGRVIFTSDQRGRGRASSYLQIGRVDRLESRIAPERFDQLALQLLSSGMAVDREGLVAFLAETLSASRERRRSRSVDEQWTKAIDDALAHLRQWGFINSRLRLTPVGRRVAVSGLLPRTAHALLQYMSRAARPLAALATDTTKRRHGLAEAEDVEFALMHACLCSPDFEESQGGRRKVPWMITGQIDCARGSRLDPHLIHTPWHETGPNANAADLAADWIGGQPLRQLEDRFERLRGGDLRRMFADLGQMLAGWADIAMAATAPSLRHEDRVPSVPDPNAIRDDVRLLASVMRVTCARLADGLPREVLWIAGLLDANGGPIVSRPAAVSLATAGLGSPEKILDNTFKTDLIAALRGVYGPQKAPDKVRALQSATERRRVAATERMRESQIRRAGEGWRDIIQRVYTAPGIGFEDALNDAFEKVGITVLDRDGPGRQSFPDFVLDLPPVGTVVMECKTKAPPNVCVELTAATAVCGKATTHGYDHDYKVTVCRPYASPDVGRTLNSKRLAVVNAEDLMEALIRVATGKALLENFADWLAQPGHITLDSFVNAPRLAPTSAAAVVASAAQ